MITPELLSTNYSFGISEADEQKFAHLLEREFRLPEVDTMGEELVALPWVKTVDYNGMFGHQVFVDGVDSPTPDRLAEITAIIQRHLDRPRIPTKDDLATMDHVQRCMLVLSHEPQGGIFLLTRPEPYILDLLWSEVQRYDATFIEKVWKELGWE